MKTVPLHGKKAAGRVARVNDEDYDLVMQYRWRVHDPDPRPGRRRNGPYAVTSVGRSGVLRMHCLIMGVNGVDHRDHDGLNNQRSECGGEFQHRAAAGATYCQRQECVRKRKARSARERRLAARESREAVALLPVTSRQRVKHEH